PFADGERPDCGCLQIGRRRYFMMWKIFLRRKKSCCTAQDSALQQGKSRFLMRNVDLKPLIANKNKY
ncbi:MAG TPA: hypothetical protein VHU21_16825, partial [Paraburkholderia sp.]|nr:hypothetical protein [Paraburkholderia sp.]